MSRIELCWGCHESLGAVHVHARPPHAKIVGGGWHRWHVLCVPDTYETAEPRPERGASCTGCEGVHSNGGLLGGCCDENDCGPCCAECPTCPTLIRRRLGERAAAAATLQMQDES